MLARVRDLPRISRAALDLGNMLGRPEINNERVVRVLKQDSVLTAKLLRACNSPALGLKKGVASVDQAVLILGHKEVSRMVTALAFRGALAAPLPAYGLAAQDPWRHSLLAATAAQIVATEGLEFEVDSSVAFTIGLLHDIGKLVTNEFLTPQSSLAMRRQITEGCSLAQAERDVLGTDHCEVGAALLYIWRLPDPIVEAVGLHHQKVLQLQPRLPVLACFADALAHRAASSQAGGQAHSPDTDTQVFNALGLSPEKLESLLARVREFPTIPDAQDPEA
jgi:putative nucleotidyltransferase with HDIG domain